MSEFNSLEYILKLFKVSADQLHIDYVKETPTRLQKWTQSNKPPFIALLNVNSNATLNDAQRNLITYDLTFVVVADNKRDPSTEEKEKIEKEASVLVNKFVYMVKKNQDITLNSWGVSEFFRDNTYLGIGKGLTMNLTIGDHQSYCDLYCNTQTEIIDCNS